MNKLRIEEESYRLCVGIMLFNSYGNVFTGKRMDYKTSAWQMPQGGIELGENTKDAAFRELSEETGITYEKVEFVEEMDEWLYYEIPKEMISNLCMKINSVKDNFEISFSPTRVLMQDFTGVPAVADLAAMRDALKEKGVEIDKDNLSLIVKAVRGAMHKVVPGPMAVMKWIEDEVSKAIKRGATELEWATPSGFVVHQKLMKKNWEILNLQLLGRCQLKVATDDTSEVDISRHKAATAPNLIHSLDASLLHLSIIKFDAPIALIHDSVLSRATDMSILSTLIRETYMYLFAEHDYLTDFAKQIGAETKPPIIGDLNPSSVVDSTYFFC